MYIGEKKDGKWRVGKDLREFVLNSLAPPVSKHFRNEAKRTAFSDRLTRYNKSLHPFEWKKIPVGSWRFSCNPLVFYKSCFFLFSRVWSAFFSAPSGDWLCWLTFFGIKESRVQFFKEIFLFEKCFFNTHLFLFYFFFYIKKIVYIEYLFKHSLQMFEKILRLRCNWAKYSQCFKL